MSTFTLIGKVVGYSRGGTPGGKDTQKYNIDNELFQSSCENFVKVDSDEEEVSINQSRQEDLSVGGRGETCLLQTLSCFLVKAGS